MKKRRRYILIVIVCIFAMGAGCAKSENEKDETVQSTQTVVDLKEAKEQKLVLENDSFNYEEKTDAQSFLYAAEVTKAPDGYYYWDEMNETGLGMLMYYDTQSGKSVPLCSRPNCSHDNTECNAYFNRAGETGDYFDRSFIQYYDGNVYILGYDSEQYVNLYKVAADGSSWEKYMRLYKADMTSSDGTDSNSDIQTTQWTPPRVMIHRGYVYYVIWNESAPKIRRIELGGTTTEVLYETTGERASIDWMKIYGDYVFWRSVNYTDENYNDFEGAVLAYQISTGKLYTVKTGDVGDFYLQDHYFYYTTATGIGRYNLETMEDKTIAETGAAYAKIRTDSQYIYTYDWDTYTLSVHTLEGEKVASLTDKDISNCWFGDDQYFFARALDSKAIVDVKELQQGKAIWKKME